MVLIQAWPPHLALAPIAQADPPFMPFRDAGYAPADFVLTIQDVVYGVWRAKEQKLIDIRSFDLEEYELYERVDQGDFNEIAPHFVAFASPQQAVSESGSYDQELNYPFQQVLDYFTTHDVLLVVRLNSHLYNKTEFETRGIKHIDLIFEDGTCPTMDFVQAFIGAVEGVIAQGGKVAVHCKAGLGRTGCLIGAHLIYTHGFTAVEAIAYMRFLRPGMVVGPQQHWLYLHQNEFRDWRRTMAVSRVPSAKLAGYCPLVPKAQVLSRSQARAGGEKAPPRTPERNILSEVEQANSALPVPTPGQPRKNSPTPAGRAQYGSPMAKRYVDAATVGQVNSDDNERITSFEADTDYDIDSGNENSNDYDQIYNDAETSIDNETIDQDDDVDDDDDHQTSEDHLQEKQEVLSAAVRDKPLHIAKRASRTLSTTGPGPLRSNSRRIMSAANVSVSGSPERRKPSISLTTTGANAAGNLASELFGDEENVDLTRPNGGTGDGETVKLVALPKSRRTVTADALTHKQQLMLMRRRQIRSTSNPSSLQTSSSSPQQRRNGGVGGAGGSKAASFQVLTTMTTTTTTTTTLAASPPTSTAAGLEKGFEKGYGGGHEGGVHVKRTTGRVVSGVRKTSGGGRLKR